MEAALKPIISTGPPMALYSSGDITPSVVFSATVSIVAQIISRSVSLLVSRPTMRATCLRPASTPPELSARFTPTASCARHRAERPIQLTSAMPTSSGQRPMSDRSHIKSAVTAMVMSTVEAVSSTAPRRRLPPRARSLPSQKDM